MLNYILSLFLQKDRRANAASLILKKNKVERNIKKKLLLG